MAGAQENGLRQRNVAKEQTVTLTTTSEEGRKRDELLDKHDR
jgi:hypothetical protein